MRPKNLQILSPYRGIHPQVDESVFIAGGARVIGDVIIGERSSVWYNAVVRGDVNEARIGNRVNVQDNAVIHGARAGQGTYIEDDVTIGHGAIVHACNVGAGSLIGMHACVLDGARVEAGAMVAAGAVVTPRKIVPSGELWAGVPARKLRDLSHEELEDIKASAQHYASLAQEYLSHLHAEAQRRREEEENAG
jgi:carbonic anhydrase/acetyltransferase-like protein (isoleucine patch superfamily)